MGRALISAATVEMKRTKSSNELQELEELCNNILHASGIEVGVLHVCRKFCIEAVASTSLIGVLEPVVSPSPEIVPRTKLPM